MPNRIIKESIWTSPNLNNLSDLAERHFYRILPLPDDFGCCELTPLVVKGKCYPLKDVSDKDIDSWQQELEDNGVLVRWDLNGRQYGIFTTFSKHQRIRSLHERKTPAPPADVQAKCDSIEVPRAEIDTKPVGGDLDTVAQEATPFRDSGKIWRSTLEELKGQVSKANFRTWLENTQGLDYQKGFFIIGVPNSFTADYLVKNQQSKIQKALTVPFPEIKGVQFKILDKEVSDG